MSRRVADASPVIFLARLGLLPLLGLGVQEVLVPSEVIAEVRAKPDAAAVQVEAHLGDWLRECPTARPDLLQLLPDLGRVGVHRVRVRIGRFLPARWCDLRRPR